MMSQGLYNEIAYQLIQEVLDAIEALHKPFTFDGEEWFAMYDGRMSPPFNCRGAAMAWLGICRRTGSYRS